MFITLCTCIVEWMWAGGGGANQGGVNQIKECKYRYIYRPNLM